jgi:hypothetical protein
MDRSGKAWVTALLTQRSVVPPCSNIPTPGQLVRYASNRKDFECYNCALKGNAEWSQAVLPHDTECQIERVEHLHGDTEIRNTPVIVLTANADDRQRLDGSVRRCIQKGTVDQQTLLSVPRDNIAKCM